MMYHETHVQRCIIRPLIFPESAFMIKISTPISQGAHVSQENLSVRLTACQEERAADHGSRCAGVAEISLLACSSSMQQAKAKSHRFPRVRETSPLEMRPSLCSIRILSRKRGSAEENKAELCSAYFHISVEGLEIVLQVQRVVSNGLVEIGTVAIRLLRVDVEGRKATVGSCIEGGQHSTLEMVASCSMTMYLGFFVLQ